MQLNCDLVYYFSFAAGKANEINTQLTKMVNKFCKKIDNERDVEIMLLDTTYQGLEVLEVIVKYEFIDLLKSSVVDNVISKFWQGPYERNIFPSN